YTVDEWLSSPGLRRAAVHPDDRGRAGDNFGQFDTLADRLETEFRYITKSGEVVWIHNSAHIVRDDDGHPLYWQGFLTDVTNRKLAEEELLASEQRLRSVVDLSPIGIVTLSPSGVIETANQAFQRLLGYTEDELRGHLPS